MEQESSGGSESEEDEDTGSSPLSSPHSPDELSDDSIVDPPYQPTTPVSGK